jgi:hypothetical protein
MLSVAALAGRASPRTLLVALVCGAVVPQAAAAILYESGTLGPTGVPMSEFSNGNVPGSNINSSVFLGVRLHVSQQAELSSLGGHFVGASPSTFFGAIVRLSDETDFPDSANITTPDVLAATLLNFPSPSAEVTSTLTGSLAPGWYAIVFGSGLFGATGVGGAARNNTDVNGPSYISYDPNLGWFNLSSLPMTPHNFRFFLNGQVVPEPLSWHLIMEITFFMAIATRAWPRHME